MSDTSISCSNASATDSDLDSDSDSSKTPRLEFHFRVDESKKGLNFNCYYDIEMEELTEKSFRRKFDYYDALDLYVTPTDKKWSLSEQNRILYWFCANAVSDVNTFLHYYDHGFRFERKDLLKNQQTSGHFDLYPPVAPRIDAALKLEEKEDSTGTQLKKQPVSNDPKVPAATPLETAKETAKNLFKKYKSVFPQAPIGKRPVAQSDRGSQLPSLFWSFLSAVRLEIFDLPLHYAAAASSEEDSEGLAHKITGLRYLQYLGEALSRAQSKFFQPVSTFCLVDSEV